MLLGLKGAKSVRVIIRERETERERVVLVGAREEVGQMIYSLR